MLAYKYRFHRRNAINYLYKNGKSARSGPFQLRYIDNRHDHSRVAVVVSRKVDKRATVRNRIRRRIYEIIRANWDNLSPRKDILISVFEGGVADMPAAELQQEVLGLLKKAQLLR
ncbi:MAG: ribonuclease P protein component [Candidatus Saccharimonadales bacterium]|nr:ribonuclease P protein component [Candidatus Saccharimonadales bacterium]